MFFSRTAPFLSSFNLAVQMVVAIGLLAAMFLARRKVAELHCQMQTGITVAGIILAGSMVFAGKETYLADFLASGDFFNPGASLLTSHMILGTATLVVSLYIQARLRGFLPRRLIFGKFQTHMKITGAAWLLNTAFGMLLYFRTYPSA